VLIPARKMTYLLLLISSKLFYFILEQYIQLNFIPIIHMVATVISHFEH